MSFHDLTPLTKPKPSPKFQVLDIETMNWTKFIVLGYYDGENYLEFRTLKAFVNYIKTKEHQNIFAHFGGKFDLLFILKECLKHDSIKISRMIPRGSSILGLEITYKTNKINFRDSAALLPFGLKSLAENFGVPQQKQEWDHTKTKCYSKELSTYLKADCLALYQCIEKFYDWPLIKASGPAYTVASQAMKVFRTFIKKPIHSLTHNLTEELRPAYLGGRTEIFKPFYKGGKLYEYDVNSLYPFVMVANAYPIDKGYATFKRRRGSLGIFRARCVVPSDLHIPCLGIVRDNKYIFPKGTFEGLWCGVELDYAQSLGYQVEILDGHEFKTKEMIFKDYVDSLYQIRETSPKNSVSNVLAKLLMNSLYGRFGMNLDRESISFDLKEGNKEYRTVTINKKKIMLFTEPTKLETFTHIGIAAHVTAYARIHMHKLMMKHPKEIYYTDTDSLFTTKEMPTGKALGELKLEHTYDSACFLLPKTYIATSATKKKIAMKGFDRKKIQDFTFEDFTRAFEGDLKRMKTTSEPKFASIKSALAQQKIVTMTKATTKQLRALYTKRIILPNGETEPITLQE